MSLFLLNVKLCKKGQLSKKLFCLIESHYPKRASALVFNTPRSGHSDAYFDPFEETCYCI